MDSSALTPHLIVIVGSTLYYWHQLILAGDEYCTAVCIIQYTVTTLADEAATSYEVHAVAHIHILVSTVPLIKLVYSHGTL